jgi:hypothetical protein
LFPRVGFIVTNLVALSRAVRFYNKRGTAEQWIRELTFRRWLEGKSLKEIERECGALGTDPRSVKQWIGEWERGVRIVWAALCNEHPCAYQKLQK